VRQGIAAISFLLAAGCARPVPSPSASRAPQATAPAALAKSAKFEKPVEPETVQLPPAAAARVFPPHLFQSHIGDITVSGVIFDQRTYELKIADQPGGPGSKWDDAKAAGSAFGGVAAVNAGFFTPEGAPLGLVMSQGRPTGALNSSSLGAGFVIGGSSPALIRRQLWSNAREAVQSGPFLLESGRSDTALSTVISTARTFIANDGGSQWVIARTGPCSLAQLATALNGANLGGMKPVNALNLDGGRSSDLWVSGAVPGGPLHERPIWNKPVRNFLVLAPR
jgi:uncharacterized protein YigE (DUF2233 family)